jgi:MGT family glycosyltransferase
MWRRIFATFSDMRQKAGFSPLPSLDELWRPRERLISTSLADFDTEPEPGWTNVVHVGPALEDEKFALPATLPWAEDDAAPLVLMSFSTGFEQRDVDKVQRVLDALAGEPVHVVATTGGIVAPSEVAVPGNAVVLNYAAHDPILRRARLVVGHGGHGTAMRALRHGVPMVVVPGLASDQPYVAAAIQEWGAGLALPGNADAPAIRGAVRRVLAEPSFAAAARRRQAMLGSIDGAANAADEVEALLSASRAQRLAAAVL